MITDIIQGLNSNRKVQCSNLNVQRKRTNRGIREIRGRCLNLFYITIKEMVGEIVKNE